MFTAHQFLNDSLPCPSLTHTVIHTPKCPEKDSECQTGSSAFLPGFFAGVLVSHDLRHEIPHRLCRPILLLSGDVGVEAEGEARIVVTQHTGDCFHVHAVLESQSRKCVPLRYNYDKPEKPRTSRAFGYLARFFILFQTEKSSREVVIS